jgi:hypothetical protein
VKEKTGNFSRKFTPIDADMMKKEQIKNFNCVNPRRSAAS